MGAAGSSVQRSWLIHVAGLQNGLSSLLWAYRSSADMMFSNEIFPDFSTRCSFLRASALPILFGNACQNLDW
jgi:hypothetical protein